jgi:hypothetical protein
MGENEKCEAHGFLCASQAYAKDWNEKEKKEEVSCNRSLLFD